VIEFLHRRRRLRFPLNASHIYIYAYVVCKSTSAYNRLHTTYAYRGTPLIYVYIGLRVRLMMALCRGGGDLYNAIAADFRYSIIHTHTYIIVIILLCIIMAAPVNPRVVYIHVQAKYTCRYIII